MWSYFITTWMTTRHAQFVFVPYVNGQPLQAIVRGQGLVKNVLVIRRQCKTSLEGMWTFYREKEQQISL